MHKRKHAKLRMAYCVPLSVPVSSKTPLYSLFRSLQLTTFFARRVDGLKKSIYGL